MKIINVLVIGLAAALAACSGNDDLTQTETAAPSAEPVAATPAKPNILLIVTDCPALDRHRLRAAAEALLTHDAVIHPTLDGGYALLGLRRFDSSLFAGIGWSGPDVAADTIARIEALGWSLHVGDTLRDIDEPEDLAAAGIA